MKKTNYVRESIENDKRYYSLNDIDQIGNGRSRDVAFYSKKIVNGEIIKTSKPYYESSFTSYIVDIDGYSEALNFIISDSVYNDGVDEIKTQFRHAREGEDKFNKQNIVMSSYIYQGDVYIKTAYSCKYISGNANAFVREVERLEKKGDKVNFIKLKGLVFRNNKPHYKGLSFISLKDLNKLKSVATENKKQNFEKFINMVKKFKSDIKKYDEILEKDDKNNLTNMSQNNKITVGQELTKKEERILKLIREEYGNEDLLIELENLRNRVKELEEIEHKYNSIKNLLK